MASEPKKLKVDAVVKSEETLLEEIDDCQNSIDALNEQVSQWILQSL